jgi:CRP-like cAMP-binding protein
VANKRQSTTLPSANRPPPSATPTNVLLDALPAGDFSRIRSSLDVVPLKLKEVLQRPGEPIRYVYFPTGGFFSMLTILEDGRMVEVATIGREGMVGVTAAWTESPVPFVVMGQAESDACYRMTAEAFRREMDRRGAFYDLLSRYSQALLGCVMQSTACNAVHSIEQRLARWLLLAQDRVGTLDLQLTQEFVAMMLGATRPTVTIVAGTLQKAGLIDYRHGRVSIKDRERLEEASCECYRTANLLLKAVTNGASRPR